MTKDEAIQILSTRDAHGILCGYTSGVTEALDMAIEALSEPTCKKCTDLISREEASKAIEAETTEAWTESDADFNRGMDMAKSIVESLPSAEPKTGEWIPVSERLPDNPKDVLTTLSNGMVCIGRHHSFNKWTFEAASIMVAFPEEAVIAWMPLPEPYREDGE